MVAVASALLSACFASLAAPPTVGGCQVLPANNYWNTPIDALPVHASSAAWVSTIGNTARLHPDWGNVLADNYGIPYTTVTGAQPLVEVHGQYEEESDPGPYPIPPNAPIEGGPASGGDRHVLVIETTNCILYELFDAFPQVDGSWIASSFAKWPLNSNDLRPPGWTSADAAGLPIFAGLVRYEEAAVGEIAHAIRFTADSIWGMENGQPKYLWPARHWSGSLTNPNFPPMGARFRLKSSFAISPSFHPLTQTIHRAFKKYGLVLADRGSNWFFQGVSHESWPDQVFDELKTIAGSNFEAVDTSVMMIDVNSAQARQPSRVFGISTRMQVLTGEDVLIGGFIVGGSTAKNVIVRARGPSLGSAGVANTLANPMLQLVRASDQQVIGTNDDWGSAANAAQISASGFAPADASESAILMSLSPGAYTAIVSGVNNGTGVGIVEVYEIDYPQVPLTGISTRGQVQGGDGVMIGGFTIQGEAPQTVIVRARGPSLGSASVANPLSNPTLTLVSGQSVLATNDDWGTAANAVQVQASGFAPAHPQESAILISLFPGAYTAIVGGAGGATGVGIVEVYVIQ
jgi:hypothetical protein